MCRNLEEAWNLMTLITFMLSCDCVHCIYMRSFESWVYVVYIDRTLFLDYELLFVSSSKE